MEKELLKFIRASFRMNQQKFADELSFSKCYIAYLETGIRPITPAIEQKVLDTFSISREELNVYKMLQAKRT
jgi:transcriptional regulator with XRE-family HTH domain